MSVSSMGLALPPRGLRVKNANVFALSASARFAMARYPPAEAMWQPLRHIRSPQRMDAPIIEHRAAAAKLATAPRMVYAVYRFVLMVEDVMAWND